MIRAVLCAAFAGLAWGASALAHDGHGTPTPHWQQASGWPDRIITTFADDPATTLSFTWRTDDSVGRTIAQLAPATPDARFDLSAQTLRAKTEFIDLERMRTENGVRRSPYNQGLGMTAYHSVTFEDLEPNTLYAWRVQGARGQWSEWFQTRTAAKDGPITFVYFGDAQNGIYSHWSRVIRAALLAAPKADFFLHAGDLVQKGDADYNWAEWFHAGGFVHAMIPAIPVPGNHENISVWPDDPDGALFVDAQGERIRTRTPIWRAQFTLPADAALPETLREQAYVVPYSDDLDVFVVDSARTTQADFEAQAQWLDAALEASQARWTVVSMHHPYFLGAQFDRRDRDGWRREALAPVIAKHKVDFVLAGHIHTYNRMTLPAEANDRAVRRATGDARGVETVFVISSSGAKNGDNYDTIPIEQIAGDGAPDVNGLSIDRVAGNTPMFQIITIDGDVARYEARDATGELYDAMSVTKQADGTKRLTEGEAAYGDTRLFSNTGPYQEWWDLR